MNQLILVKVLVGLNRSTCRVLSEERSAEPQAECEEVECGDWEMSSSLCFSLTFKQVMGLVDVLWFEVIRW